MKEKTHAFFRLLSALLLALLIVPAFAQTAAAEEIQSPACYQHGDVNGDNSVDGRDAIYTLYHSLLHSVNSAYPVSQDCDFNGDGAVDKSDAVFVLYGSLGISDKYVLEGTIHEYYAPVWTWSEDRASASVTFQCGCGQSHDYDAAVETVSTEPTCTDAGSVVYTASVTFEGSEYTDTYTEILQPTGHQMEGVQTCTESSACAVCDYVLEALDHNWKLTEEIAATCVSQGTLTYQCQREDCGEINTVTPDGFGAHSFSVFQRDIPVEGCLYQKEYKCAHCDETATGETFYQHVYTAVLTQEATCTQSGVMTYTCDCGDSYTADIPTNDSHIWDAGVTDEATGITTYTCGCGESKTALLAAGTEATVSSTDLADSELQLSGAIVKLDEDTLDALAEEVVVSVETADVSDLALSEEQQAQIGDNPVYDFNLTSGEEQVSEFAGLVTISVPYTLQEGDDTECIDIWYIADDGTVACVGGTYSNGYVTFSVSHFSYYTVTRLTAAERCAHYGHVWTVSHQDPSCTQAGHDTRFCQRCGEMDYSNILPVVDHKYEPVAGGTAAATCTENGTYEKICSVCNHVITGITPATGHDWKLDEAQSTAATCTAAGKEVYVCGNGCDETITSESAATGHDFGDATTTAPDCTSAGYDLYTCGLCGETFTTSQLAPMGHSYDAESAEWIWAGDYSSATVTLTCDNDSSHVLTLNAVVTAALEAPNCTGSGTKTFTATAAHNGALYTDSVSVNVSVAGHQSDNEWKHSKYLHYQHCTVCGERTMEGKHAWLEAEVVTQADCHTDGLTRRTCATCGAVEETVISATGEHNFVNGVCSVCDFVKADCQHIRIYPTYVDLSSYNVCQETELVWERCDCGSVCNLFIFHAGEFDTTTSEKEAADGSKYTLYHYTCKTCDMEWANAWYVETSAENCISYEVNYNECFINGKNIAKNNRKYELGQHGTNIPVGEVDMTTLGMCGGKIVTYRCLCGERTHTYMEEIQCIWDHTLGENNTHIYYCEDCDTTRTHSNTSTPTTGVCTYIHNSTNVYTRNGQQIYSFSNINTYIEHDVAVADFVMAGADCEDGVTVTEVCKECGYEYSYYTTGHPTIPVREYDLTGTGMCGGTLTQAECPCGQHQGYRSDDNCDWHYMDEDSNGNDVYDCSVCGSRKTRKEVIGMPDANCRANRQIIWNYYDPAGDLVATLYDTYTSTRHDYTNKWVLHGESCEDGVDITRSCTHCGYEYTYYAEHHTTEIDQTYDLADYGMCNGELEVSACPCGYYSYVYDFSDCDWYWDSEDENGNITYRCDKCGIIQTETLVSRTELEDCRYREELLLTYKRDGKTILEVTDTNFRSHHDYVYTFTLHGESCEDGVDIVTTCRNCDYLDEYRNNYHESFRVEAIDLSEYGAACEDSYLIHEACPCGEYVNYEFDWNSGCEWDYVWYSAEVAGALTGGQYSTNGWNNFDPEECIITCAVTDPACGAKIRRLDYWTYEGNCTAVQHQIWQLGYDEVTNTCQRGISVTSNTIAYHNYTVMTNTETLEDGTVVQTEQQLCPDCGSSYTYTYTSYPDGTYKYSHNAINTLDNGEDQRWIEEVEHLKVISTPGYLVVYETRDYQERTFADGRVFYWDYIYEYDFSNGCVCTAYHTDSDGYSDSWEYDCHHTVWNSYKDPTCSQFGYESDQEYCVVCNEIITDNGRTDIAPYAHDWYYDEYTGLYCCSYCGLENTNGASGEIVIEDLTDSYGYGNDYVVGYWNRGDLDFTTYVSVILNDAAEGTQDELMLTDVPCASLDRETDGITAYAFNQSDALAAAEAAMADAGYTGSYAIRFTFVPINHQDDLDYAITFDSLIRAAA